MPDWLAYGTLLSLGLIYAVHEVNLPSPASQLAQHGSPEIQDDDSRTGGGDAVTSIHRRRREAMAGV